MNKKRIFGIILFILIGFFMFTFANPNEKVEDEKGKTKTEEKDKKEKKGMDVVKPVAIIEDENTNKDVVVNNALPTENNIPSVQTVDNTKEIEKALELERTKKAAIEELVNYKKDYDYTNKEKSEEIVKEYTDAINDAKDKSDVDRLLNDAYEKIDELIIEDLTDYINNAILDIKNHAKDDEKYISEIIDEKNSAIEKLEKIKETDIKDIDYKNIKKEIEEIVEVTKDNINNIVANKTFTVTFVGKNGVKAEETIKYKESAEAPATKAFVNPIYKDVTYELTGWDKDFSEVKEDLTINAEYKISKIEAHLYLNEDVMPNPKDKNAKKYSYLGIYELKTDNEVLNAAILADINKTVYTNDNEFDIKSLFKDETKLPTLESVYDSYEYYVVKFVSEGTEPSVHVDCIKRHDSVQELLDLLNVAKEAAIDNITNHLTNVQVNQDKVEETINKYVGEVEKAKTIEEVNKIEKEAIEELDKIEIVDTKAPTIKINGSRVVNVEVYGDYTELGATMTDDYDEDISNLQPSGIHYYKFVDGEYKFVKAVDHIDTTKLGMYKVSYSYTDKAGNKSVNALNKKSNHVIREVYVKDTQAPQIKLNGKLTINLEYMEDNYVEAGATVTDNYDQTIANLQPKSITYSKLNEKGEYVKVGNTDKVDTTKEGLYKLFYEYTDASGNKSVNAHNTASNFVTRFVYVKDTKVTITFKAKGFTYTNTFTKGEVVAPTINPYIVNGVTYSFKNWGVDNLQSIVDDTTLSANYYISSIKTKSGIELDETNNDLLNIISKNENVTLTDNIKSYAKNQDDLKIVVDDSLNYKVYTSLVYNPLVGFEYTTETRTVVTNPVNIGYNRKIGDLFYASFKVNSVNEGVSNIKYYLVDFNNNETTLKEGGLLANQQYVKVTYTDDATGANLVAYYKIERDSFMGATYITGLSYSHTIKA